MNRKLYDLSLQPGCGEECGIECKQHDEHYAQLWAYGDGGGFFLTVGTVYWEDQFSPGCASELKEPEEYDDLDAAKARLMPLLDEWYASELVSAP